MPYLPVDLDAKRKAHGIERALGLPRHAVAGGLTDLWEVVWRDKSDVVDDLTLDEAFGPDARIRAALVAREFLEPVEGGHRVRGAAKWLFGLEGKSRGGKAATVNLLRGPKPKEAEATKTHSPASAGEEPKTSRTQPPADTPALTPNTQHPAPNKPKKAFKNIAGEQPPAERAEEKIRLKVLTELLVADYAVIRHGDSYLHQGEKDTLALKRIIATESDNEKIRGRWRYGLRQKHGEWLAINTLAQLGHKFNDLAGFYAPLPGASPPPVPKQPKPTQPTVVHDVQEALW